MRQENYLEVEKIKKKKSNRRLAKLIFFLLLLSCEDKFVTVERNYIDAENKEVRYIGRKPAASPATGYIKRHIDQQKQIVEKVLI